MNVKNVPVNYIRAIVTIQIFTFFNKNLIQTANWKFCRKAGKQPT